MNITIYAILPEHRQVGLWLFCQQ